MRATVSSLRLASFASSGIVSVTPGLAAAATIARVTMTRLAFPSRAPPDNNRSSRVIATRLPTVSGDAILV